MDDGLFEIRNAKNKTKVFESNVGVQMLIDWDYLKGRRAEGRISALKGRKIVQNMHTKRHNLRGQNLFFFSIFYVSRAYIYNYDTWFIKYRAMLPLIEK